MKVYSIGREIGCDIVINDNSDVISRRHAVLNVKPSGKMTIVDQSHNGTYVNGMRITANVPFPVTRKDSVSFAHVAPLDWNLVPKATGVIVRNILLGLLALLLAGGIAWGIYTLTSGSDSDFGGFGGGSDSSVNVPANPGEDNSATDPQDDKKTDVDQGDTEKKDNTDQKKDSGNDTPAGKHRGSSTTTNQQRGHTGNSQDGKTETEDKGGDSDSEATGPTGGL